MSIQYSVNVRETCPKCENGIIYNPLWEQCAEEIGDMASNEATWEWFYVNDYLVDAKTPPEEINCPDCCGLGYTISECSLQDAPPVVDLRSRMERMEDRFHDWVQTSPINSDWESIHGES